MRQRDRRDYCGLSFFLQKCIVCMVALRRIAGTIRVSALGCRVTFLAGSAEVLLRSRSLGAASKAQMDALKHL